MGTYVRLSKSPTVDSPGFSVATRGSFDFVKVVVSWVMFVKSVIETTSYSLGCASCPKVTIMCLTLVRYMYDHKTPYFLVKDVLISKKIHWSITCIHVLETPAKIVYSI